MTNPLRLAHDNDIDIGIVSAGSAIGSLPASNVQTPDPRRIWRSAAGFTWLLADLGRSLSMEYMLLWNCITDDQVRVRVSSSDATGASGDVYDSGLFDTPVDPANRRFIHFVEPTGALGRYVRIDGVSEAGRWSSGSAFKPSRDMQFGVEYLWRDRSRRSESVDHTMHVDRRRGQEGIRFAIRGLTQTEAQDTLYQFNRVAGSSRDIMICRDKDADDLGKATLWGLMEAPATVRQWSEKNTLYEVEMEVWERL